MKWLFHTLLLVFLVAGWGFCPVTAAPEQTYSDEQAIGVLTFHKLHFADLKTFYPKHPAGKEWKHSQLERFIKNASVPGGMISSVTPPEPPKPAPPQKLWGIKIRQDHADVVAEEDPSATDPKKRNELAGAAFSYTRDFVADGDSWTVRGALIRPITLHKIDRDVEGFSFHDPLTLESAYLIPSVSIHKVSSDFDPKSEVDSLIYRLGASAAWTLARASFVSEFEFRGFVTYGTDTSHDSSIVAGEFDFEPRIYGSSGSLAKAALGTPASLSGRAPDEDGNNSNFIYQLRTYLHGEFGEVDDTGGNPDIQTGSFFRMGPVASLEMYPCFLARALGRDALDLSINVAYSLLPTVSGEDFGKEDYFSAGLDLTLFKGEDEDSYQKVTLKLLYERGGLDLTKEEVETFTVGMGITF